MLKTKSGAKQNGLVYHVSVVRLLVWITSLRAITFVCISDREELSCFLLCWRMLLIVWFIISSLITSGKKQKTPTILIFQHNTVINDGIEGSFFLL